ncbi:glycosyltransferase [Eubacterium oxidoreducens]|uniref:Glycosyltransferase involved in cell wall bisynthesis n=1 Tax=Eubacterium oxidoreducens TaxID=1732 RepID=A0A1G6CB38_EUBOX|nr:glycosyltransferase [Eubacterium oxidoreducens]SDB30117.1 Glycosyltransferase involved in cell wall bisynthesis [Eubacterium oxidoreducens]
MKRALVVTTTSGFMPQFELNNVRLLQEAGYQVHYATNFGVPIYESRDETLSRMGVVLHPISIEKNPFRIRKNMWAYKELVRIIFREHIDVVHCHNPNGGVLARLAAKKSKRNPYVLYTAHGFHFFKGAPWKNWLFYYPVEKYLARYTDVLITINQEDYNLAKSFTYKAGGGPRQIPGVGVDTARFYPPTKTQRCQAREQLEIPKGAFHLVSVGELNENKNHRVVIEAIARLGLKDIYYSICGEGPVREKLEKLIEAKGLQKQVFLRGYCTQIDKVLWSADAFVFPSYREGLGMAALEAMACGVAMIAADNRGSREYLSQESNGIVCAPQKAEEFARAIKRLYEDEKLRTEFAKQGLKTVERFTLQRNEEKMRDIYGRIPGGQGAEERKTINGPLVSVIMGVYNQSNLEQFTQAVDSILQQTMGDLEYLIYNDGSSIPEVNAYISKLEAKDSRIKVINAGENHGLGYALNRCIERAKGTYLARMDADDISHPDRFERQVAFLKEHPEYMWCGSNCRLFDEQGIWGEGTRPKNPQTQDYLKYSPYIHPSVMYRTELFESVTGYDEGKKTARCEDYELFMRLYDMGYRGYNIQKPLLDYRVSKVAYHTRAFRYYWYEAQIRFEGFRRLGVLWPKGWLYVLRPLISKMVPTKLIVLRKARAAEL